MDYTYRELSSMYDTIAIKSEEEMLKIVDRCGEIEDDFDSFLESKQLPLKLGFLYIQDYEISVLFELVGDNLELNIMLNHNSKEGHLDFLDRRCYFSFFYSVNLVTRERKSPELMRDVPSDVRDKLLSVEKRDGTCEKVFSLVAVALYYMAKYRYEPVEVENHLNRAERKKLERKNNFKKLPLVTKRYNVSSDTHGHHVITCPAWEVRGYYRHYKNGKVIWVDGYTKGKERDKIAPKKKIYSGI